MDTKEDIGALLEELGFIESEEIPLKEDELEEMYRGKDPIGDYAKALYDIAKKISDLELVGVHAYSQLNKLGAKNAAKNYEKEGMELYALGRKLKKLSSNLEKIAKDSK